MIAVGLVLVAQAAGVLDGTELRSVDARFDVRGDRGAPAEVVVVAVDDVTFDELDRRWPFPRSLHGRVVSELAAAEPRAIAVDIQFTEPSRNPAQDNALIEAVASAGGVVLATTETTEDGESRVFGGEEVLREIGARSGNALMPTDPGGIMRRLPYDVGGLKTFAIVAAEQALGRPIARAELGGRTALIDYAGPPGSVETVSYAHVLDGRVPASTFRDRVVVVGPSATSLQDLHPTSTTENDVMSGAEIQANAIVTALRGFPLQSGPGWLDALLLVGLGLLGPAVLALLRPRARGAAARGPPGRAARGRPAGARPTSPGPTAGESHAGP